MASFSAKGLTNKGRTLQAKAQAGTELKYTKFVVGDGQLGGQTVPNLLNVISPKKTIQISRLKMTPPNQATIGFVLSNQDITTGFYMREIGLYALDPNDGEILYWYGNAFDTADYIPPGSAGGSDIIEKSFDILVFVGQAQNVTATIDKSLVFATQKDLNDAIAGIVIKDASTTQKGIVQLSSSTSGTSEGKAATEKAVKAAYDRGSDGVKAAAAAQEKADAAETPAGAQAKADVAQLAATNAAVVEATTKADAAESKAKTYTDDQVTLINTKLRSVNDWLEAIDLDYIRQPGFSLTTGTAIEYTVTLNPAPTSLPSGFGITILPHVDCGDSPTLKIGSLAAVALRDQKGNAFTAGKLKSGYPYTFRKVGSDFFAVSGGGGEIEISGQQELDCIYGESMKSGDAAKLALGNTYSRLTDPEKYPNSGAANWVAFSGDGRYLAVAHQAGSSGTCLSIYKRFGDSFSRLSTPTVAGTGNGVCFSPDGNYLVIAHSTSPYISIFKRSGDTFTKLADPATKPSGIGYGVCFSPDGSYLAVSSGAAPNLIVYKRSGDTFTKLTDPATLPGASCAQVAFSPDGNHLAITCIYTPFVYIYSRNGDTFTKLANPSILPTGRASGLCYSPDGNFLVVGHSSSPWITIYKRSGETYTKLANPPTLPPQEGNGVQFSPDSSELAVGCAGSPYVVIYKVNGDTFNMKPNTVLPSYPAGQSNSVTYSPHGQFLSVGWSVSGTTTPAVYVYKRLDIATKSGNNIADGLNAIAVGYALDTKNSNTVGRFMALFYDPNRYELNP